MSKFSTVISFFFLVMPLSVAAKTKMRTASSTVSILGSSRKLSTSQSYSSGAQRSHLVHVSGVQHNGTYFPVRDLEPSELTVCNPARPYAVLSNRDKRRLEQFVNQRHFASDPNMRLP